MKCAKCQSELVIPDGITHGFCMSCGTAFNVEKSGAQVLDDSAVDRIAERTAILIIHQILQAEQHQVSPCHFIGLPQRGHP